MGEKGRLVQARKVGRGEKVDRRFPPGGCGMVRGMGGGGGGRTEEGGLEVGHEVVAERHLLLEGHLLELLLLAKDKEKGRG